MIGSQAERNLLGALILDAKQYRRVMPIVSADDYSDPRLGPVYAGIAAMISRGDPVDQISVANHWPAWGIRGIDPGEIFQWTSAEIRPYLAVEYAASVREASVRRMARAVAERIATEVADPAYSVLDAVSNALNTLGTIRAGQGAGMTTKTLAEILAGSDSYDWVIPNLLERRDRLILTGGEGAGKTTFVRQLAILAAAGVHPITFRQIQPVRVLVVDAENTERQWRRATRPLVDRARYVGAADPSSTVHIAAGMRIDITRGPHLAQIHELIDAHKPDVLFIGPLYKLVPRAITNDDDAAPLIVALDSLRERDVALVMEAHAGKSLGAEGERDLRPRGSSALLGWPEFGLGLRATDDPDVVRVIRWRGDRDSRDWPLLMRRGGDFPWTDDSN